MTDTEILDYMERESVNFFCVERDQRGEHLRRNGPLTVALFNHHQPMKFRSGEGPNLRAAIADLIAKNPQ